MGKRGLTVDDAIGQLGRCRSAWVNPNPFRLRLDSNTRAEASRRRGGSAPDADDIGGAPSMKGSFAYTASRRATVFMFQSDQKAIATSGSAAQNGVSLLGLA